MGKTIGDIQIISNYFENILTHFSIQQIHYLSTLLANKEAMKGRKIRLEEEMRIRGKQKLSQ